MSWWTRLFGPKEQKYSTLDLFREIYGGRPSKTGVSVNWASALEVTTVLACLRVIAEGIAQVPFRLYMDSDARGGAPAPTHPLYNVLYRRPNRWQTSFEFRETIAFHAALVGNAYVFIGRVGSAREVRELIPLEPQFVSVEKKKDGALVYKYNPVSGQGVEFSADTIWHIKGPSWNGYTGLDAVKLVREAVGLAIASEAAHAEMHKGSAKISGVYSVDGNLSKEKYDFLASWLDKYAMGGERAGKPMILDLGAKFTTTQMTGVDAQHLETRAFQITEICRGFRVMPIMVGYSDKAATYASAEQMFIAHVVHTLSPWYERIEQSADVNLVTDDERRQGYYTKFTPNALMRGAARDRAEFYTRMVGSVNATPGIMTRNEIRALEELPPIEGGDELFDPTPSAAPAAAANPAP
jgi:HK97 family phage portal protein